MENEGNPTAGFPSFSYNGCGKWYLAFANLKNGLHTVADIVKTRSTSF